MSKAPPGATDKRAAFTLLELLSVLALVAVLAGMVLGAGRRAAEAGKTARAKAELAALSAALEGYRREYGDYPQTDDAARLLRSLTGRRSPVNAAINARPTLELARFTTTGALDPLGNAPAVLTDPWDQPYVYAYRVPAAGWVNHSYVLYSVGPDGTAYRTLLPGGFPDAARAENVDNLYANRN